MSLGSQTVKFVTVTDGPVDRNNIPAPVRALAAVSGCRFRPLRAAEKAGLAEVATQLWQLTAPPDAAALLATAVGEVLYDGTEDPADVDDSRFQIVGGAQPFADFTVSAFKVTVLCQKQT